MSEKVQNEIDSFSNKKVYLHVETSNGAYASRFNQSFFSSNHKRGELTWRKNGRYYLFSRILTMKHLEYPIQLPFIPRIEHQSPMRV
ncbi:DUF1806 family protein [Fictibacillus enclensis]|uniref:DUF1806 family protein n=1 Tax=Fictibacillus enclensis TaxID=1017270 RepID=UPI0025A2A55E|nr:DUF1806 family protein [Fictibacillus enclensis]MDM5336356.1 DUF1806 family protein [Fictibacillus enclensis]